MMLGYSLALFQELGQRGQPGIHLLFAAAGLMIEIYTAAGTQTLAVG